MAYNINIYAINLLLKIKTSRKMTQEEKELKLEAEKYAHNWFEMHETNNYKALKQGFEAGATSDAAKQYWFKQFEKQKLEFAIEQLKSLGQVHDESVMSERTRDKIKELEEKLSKL